jgi:hypothetical protein
VEKKTGGGKSNLLKFTVKKIIGKVSEVFLGEKEILRGWDENFS